MYLFCQKLPRVRVIYDNYSRMKPFLPYVKPFSLDKLPFYLYIQDSHGRFYRAGKGFSSGPRRVRFSFVIYSSKRSGAPKGKIEYKQ